MLFAEPGRVIGILAVGETGLELTSPLAFGYALLFGFRSDPLPPPEVLPPSVRPPGPRRRSSLEGRALRESRPGPRLAAAEVRLDVLP